MHSVTRRRLLTGIVSTAALAPWIARGWAQDTLHFTTDPFMLGVASGDPDANSVVLWTRLAPNPLEPDAGMPPTPVPVAWEIAEDDKMQRVVRRGTELALAADGHSLHVVADGLTPDRHYWYRFMAGGVESRIGRTRTLPDRGAMPARFRIVSAGCQRIERGFFTAWGDIARADIDLVFHYGDYIYEYALPADGIAKRMPFAIPGHALRKTTTLAQFRMRYALYKLDPELAAAHAAHPFIASFDDHEVVNDWGGLDSGPAGLPADEFLALRAAGFQAFYENSPVRPSLRPRTHDIPMYRSFEVGRLLRLATLDTRQYRSSPPCGVSATRNCAERHAPDRTMIGAAQERWLLDLFARRDTAWTMLGNQVLMMQMRRRDPRQDIVDTDKWDGNPAARARLLQGAADRGVSGLIAVAGDIHRGIAGNLMTDFDKPNAAPVGVEFVATSISSDGDGGPASEVGRRLIDANPHLRFYDGHRGYLICDYTPQRCEASYRTLDIVSDRAGKISTAKTFTVDVNRPGLA